MRGNTVATCLSSLREKKFIISAVWCRLSPSGPSRFAGSRAPSALLRALRGRGCRRRASLWPTGARGRGLGSLFAGTSPTGGRCRCRCRRHRRFWCRCRRRCGLIGTVVGALARAKRARKWRLAQRAQTHGEGVARERAPDVDNRLVLVLLVVVVNETAAEVAARNVHEAPIAGFHRRPRLPAGSIVGVAVRVPHERRRGDVLLFVVVVIL
mmetsp:Transcript_13913/g.46420  ORF Transcript_13913/g.46420 Transcript_13913/m.46420 type:complete len:211 (+) Transcript_13913:42-674(+)